MLLCGLLDGDLGWGGKFMDWGWDGYIKRGGRNRWKFVILLIYCGWKNYKY